MALVELFIIRSSEMYDERVLVMESLGFVPEEIFTDEQIEKMRSMRPEGRIGTGPSIGRFNRDVVVDQKG